MLDTKSDVYRSHIVDTWLKHFSGLKPNNILRVLVDSGATDMTDTDLGKGRLNVVKTNDIAHFYNWLTTMVEFLFLKTKAASKVLNYLLETVHTHKDDPLGGLLSVSILLQILTRQKPVQSVRQFKLPVVLVKRIHKHGKTCTLFWRH